MFGLQAEIASLFMAFTLKSNWQKNHGYSESGTSQIFFKRWMKASKSIQGKQPIVFIVNDKNSNIQAEIIV